MFATIKHFLLSLIYPVFSCFLIFSSSLFCECQRAKVKLRIGIAYILIEYTNVYPAASLFATTYYFCY